MYALIRGTRVENCIVADAAFAAQIAPAWTAVVAMAAPDVCGVGWTWNGGTSFTAPVQPVPPAPAPDPAQWLIDIGPFTDRFGAAKTAIDFSTDPVVMAFYKDLSRRKWIDLQDARVAAVLTYLTGVAVPGLGTLATPLLTAAQKTAILTTPIAPAENLALRKLYFRG